MSERGDKMYNDVMGILDEDDTQKESHTKTQSSTDDTPMSSDTEETENIPIPEIQEESNEQDNKGIIDLWEIIKSFVCTSTFIVLFVTCLIAILILTIFFFSLGSPISLEDILSIFEGSETILR